MNSTEPINLALREHQRSAGDWRLHGLVTELHTWAERFGVEFKLNIPVPVITVTPLRARQDGHFRTDRNDRGMLFEIAVSKHHATAEPFWEVLGTLLHELLHLWQRVHGTPPRSCAYNYHNVEYRQKAASLGLIVGRYGHTSYASENSPFLDLLKRYGIGPPVLPPTPDQQPAPRRLGSSKLKLWECACPVRVRVAVPVFRARCLVCGCLFEQRDVP